MAEAASVLEIQITVKICTPRLVETWKPDEKND